MATKLDWKYQDNGEHIAEYKGLRIRAVLDESPSNPFEDSDGNWPMSVYVPDNGRSGTLTEYDKTFSLNNPSILGRFSDHALVHNQKHIAQALGFESEGWDWNADDLRNGFQDSASDLSPSKWLDAAAGLLDILGTPHLVTEVHGYSQGDWTKLLIVATPEAVKEFRPSATPEELAEDMANQAKLYKAWAFGDVYGYVVEARTGEPFETEDDEWEEIPDGSCWGFYGSDFDWSGLEDAAMEVVDAHAKT